MQSPAPTKSTRNPEIHDARILPSVSFPLWQWLNLTLAHVRLREMCRARRTPPAHSMRRFADSDVTAVAVAAEVEVVAEDGDMVRIRYQTSFGWVAASDISDRAPEAADAVKLDLKGRRARRRHWASRIRIAHAEHIGTRGRRRVRSATAPQSLAGERVQLPGMELTDPTWSAKSARGDDQIFHGHVDAGCCHVPAARTTIGVS